MNEQVTRALYLGCCLMMIVSAFTAFFSAYHDYQAYVSHVHDFTSQHGVAREELFIESDVYITGREVAGLVLARRKAESKGSQASWPGRTSTSRYLRNTPRSW